MLFFQRAGRPLMRWWYRVRSLVAIVAGDCRGRWFGLRTRLQDAPPAIYPIYFSCAADFDYLRLSIRSLTAHAGGHVGRIYVYEDRKQPLTAAQKSALLDETHLPIVCRLTTAPMRWGGVTLLHNELRAFMDLSRELGAQDFIVKVDSDVLFAAGWLFSTVLDASADLVGQPVASLATHTRRVVPDRSGWLLFPSSRRARSAAIGAVAGGRAAGGADVAVQPVAHPRGPHHQPVGARRGAEDPHDRFLSPRPGATAQQLVGDGRGHRVVPGPAARLRRYSLRTMQRQDAGVLGVDGSARARRVGV